MSTEVKEIFINPETGRLTTSTGAILTAPPTIIYAAQPEWDITIQRWRDGQAQPLDLSDATAWRFAVDRDLLVSTTPIMRTPDSGIDHSGAASGLIKVQLDSYTAGMLTLTDGRDSTPVWAELRGLNGDGMTVYCYRFRVNALGSVDPQGGEPPETPSGYATESYVAAMCRAGYQLQFSEDGSSWHDTQSSDDTEFRFRYPSGTWSDAVAFPGQGEAWQPLITSSSMLDYGLVSGTPAIPTAVSELTNDSNYATTGQLEAATTGKIDMPEGGSTGQFLQKTADGTQWATAGGGGGNYDAQIADLSAAVTGKIDMPEGGSVGQFLQKTADGTQWATAGGGGGGDYDAQIAYLSGVITGQAARIEALQAILSGYSTELMSFTVSGSTVLRNMLTSAAPAPADPTLTLAGGDYQDLQTSYTYDTATSAWVAQNGASISWSADTLTWQIRDGLDNFYYELSDATGQLASITGTNEWTDQYSLENVNLTLTLN